MATRQTSSGGAHEQQRKLETQKIAAGETPPQPQKAQTISAKNGWTIREPKDWQTRADKLDYICQLLDATYEREPLPEDEGVRLTIKLKDGTQLGGIGATTEEALNKVLERANQFGLIKLEDA